MVTKLKQTDVKIGIVGWSTGDNSFGCTKPYLAHLEHFGQVEILTPSYGIREDLDLVVMPGGKDTLSFNYNKKPGYYNSDSDQFKEFFLKHNLNLYIEAGIPIWGTCLGMQQLVVHFGGNLVQNIPGSHGYSDPRSELVHELIFTEEYRDLELSLKKEYNLKKIESCSLHHQAARIKDLPDCLEPICYTKDSKSSISNCIVEIIRHKTLPIAGGQMHVEEDWNVIATFLIKELIERSVKNKKETLHEEYSR